MVSPNLNRRSFLKRSGAAVSAASLGATQAPLTAEKTQRPPNVILILTDDQGYGDLACHGNPWLKTPHMDALYQDSVRLSDYHVCPTCAPTRAALMTGRYSIRTGIWHTIMGRSLLRRDEKTMAEYFQESGYRTGMFGKWHLGDNYPYRPQDRGFDEVLMHGGGGVGQSPDYWGNTYFDDHYFHNGVPEYKEGYCTDRWFDAALDFVSADQEQPFFCYLATNAPHSPYRAPEASIAPYRKEGVVNPEFYGMIANLDENLGRLQKKLEAEGIEQDTLLIFMTDNGTAAGVRLDKKGFLKSGFNAGMRGMKGRAYRGGHRTPCYLRWPGGGIQGGADMAQLSAHIDILPTLMELCGLEGETSLPLDGRSLAPTLRTPTHRLPERTLCVDQQRIEHPEKWRNSCVMTEEWRLLFGKELYQIKKDPEQRKDCAGDHPEVVKALRASYEAWWASVSERFDEYCSLVIGDPKAPKVCLNAMDWHGKKVPWNQPHILEGMVANGFWAVEVARKATYRVTLRRWPEESGLALGAAPKDGKALALKSVRLRIGESAWRAAVDPAEEGLSFTCALEKGAYPLQSWFTDQKGVERGAYYVYIETLES